MVAAVALRKERVRGSRTAPIRSDALARYRHLRAISRFHNSETMRLVPMDAFCSGPAAWVSPRGGPSFSMTLTR